MALFSDEVMALLDAEGFTPRASKEKEGPLSLFEATRITLSMEPSYADVAYWNWQELRSFIAAFHRALNGVLVEQSVKPPNSAIWAIREERTVSEILDLIRLAATQIPKDYPSGRPRYQAPKMVNKGQVVGAISNTLGTLQFVSELDWGQLTTSVVGVEQMSNETFLTHLDSRCSEFPDFMKIKTKSVIPGLVARLYLLDIRLRHKDDERPRPYAEFLNGLTQDGFFNGQTEQENSDNLEHLLKQFQKMLKETGKDQEGSSDDALLQTGESSWA